MSNWDLVTAAAYTVLITDPAFTALVGTDVGKSSDDVVWLFDDARGDRPYRDPKGSGMSSVVLGSRDTWGQNAHNSLSLPVLQVLVYADTSRDSEGATTAYDAKARAYRVFDVIDAIFHDTTRTLAGTLVSVPQPSPAPNRVLTIVSSERREGPRLDPVPDGDGMERLMVRYEVAVI